MTKKKDDSSHFDEKPVHSSGSASTEKGDLLYTAGDAN
jgi:hypothetical protein